MRPGRFASSERPSSMRSRSRARRERAAVAKHGERQAERRSTDADRSASDRITRAEIGGEPASSEATDSEAAATAERAREIAANVLQRCALAKLLELLAARLA